MDIETTRQRTVASVGEFGLISRISSIVGEGSARVGIGDDAAVIDQPGDDYLLATVDMLVEDVHFRLGQGDPHDIGRRLFEVNASDIASMGGRPTYALSSIALAPTTQVSTVERIYEGLAESCRQHGASLVGGNVTRTDGPISLDLTLLGLVSKKDLVTRCGAREGDLVAVTGSLGDAAAARLIVEHDLFRDDRIIRRWEQRHAVPEARIAEGISLAAAHLIHAMMDISDGLSSDIHHLCLSSGVGARIDASRLPVSDEVKVAGEALSTNATELALSGGEDYELLIALAPEHLERAKELITIPLTVVGEVTPTGDGVSIRTLGGEIVPLRSTGWSHF